MATLPMINKDSYVTATFVDAERKTLEVLVRHHTNENEMTPIMIEADEEQQDFKDLLELVTIDQLHEQTWEQKKSESEAFMAMARNIAKEEFAQQEMAAITNIAAREDETIAKATESVNAASAANAAVDQNTLLTKTRIYPTIVDTIFSNMENEDHLFALKLALFEVQEIRESTDTATKTALRKGKNKIEVLQHAFTICGVRRMDTDDKAATKASDNDAAIKELAASTQATDGVPASVKLTTGAISKQKKATVKKTTAKKKKA
jgi:hypothetical protein